MGCELNRPGVEARMLQVDPASSGPLYAELARLDSLLFDAFFVKCDTQKTISFFTDDLEFYHDVTGLKAGQAARDAFQQCPRDNGGTRQLVEGSLRVYPIKDYGRSRWECIASDKLKRSSSMSGNRRTANGKSRAFLVSIIGRNRHDEAATVFLSRRRGVRRARTVLAPKLSEMRMTRASDSTGS